MTDSPSRNRDKALTEAVLLAARACELVQPVVKRHSVRKPDGSPVTAADLASQAILLTAVAAGWPEDRVFAEESSGLLGDKRFDGYVREVVEEASGHAWSGKELAEAIDYRGNGSGKGYWYVDPIDGTSPYRRGGHYAIALARAEDGQLDLSRLAAPDSGPPVPGVTEYLFADKRNEGIERISLDDGQSEPLNVPTEPEEGITIAAASAHRSVDLPKDLKHSQTPVQLLSMSSESKYAALVTGVAQLYPRKPSRFRGAFYRWDHAAGVLLLEELGGKATDLAGNELHWLPVERFSDNGGLFAASSVALHTTYQPLFAQHIKN